MLRTHPSLLFPLFFKEEIALTKTTKDVFISIVMIKVQHLVVPLNWLPKFKVDQFNTYATASVWLDGVLKEHVPVARICRTLSGALYRVVEVNGIRMWAGLSTDRAQWISYPDGLPST